MSPKAKKTVRKRRTAFRNEFGEDSLPIQCAFFAEETNYISEYERLNTGIPVPSYTARSYAAHAFSLPFDERCDFRAKCIPFIPYDIEIEGRKVSPDKLKNIGNYLDATAEANPRFFSKYAALCSDRKNRIHPVDKVILESPKASITELSEIISSRNLNNAFQDADLITKRRQRLFHACKQYETNRLIEFADHHIHYDPRHPCFTLVAFNDEHAGELLPEEGPEKFLTDEAWEKWPISSRVLNRTDFVCTRLTLKPDANWRDLNYRITTEPTIEGKIGFGMNISNNGNKLSITYLKK